MKLLLFTLLLLSIAEDTMADPTVTFEEEAKKPDDNVQAGYRASCEATIVKYFKLIGRDSNPDLTERVSVDNCQEQMENMTKEAWAWVKNPKHDGCVDAIEHALVTEIPPENFGKFEKAFCN